jgi:putative transposase
MVTRARKAYAQFTAQGLQEGNRADLSGGGLKRSYGGWKEVTGSDQRLKSDQRILGDSAFVIGILTQAEEVLQRSYVLKQKGYSLKTVMREIAGHFKVTEETILSRTKEKSAVEARSVLCFVAVKDLGITATHLAQYFGLTQPAISYAVRRGCSIAKERGFALQ